MKDTKIWISYHNDDLIEKYNLDKLDKNIYKLFNTSNLNVPGENINFLNTVWCEFVTMYYVWKNQIKSEQVGFCHYGRIFDNIKDLNDNECLIYNKVDLNMPLSKHYTINHSREDLLNVCTYLKYNHMDKYFDSLTKNTNLIIGSCFILSWENFNRLCEWLFNILFYLDDLYGLNKNVNNYKLKYDNDYNNNSLSYTPQYQYRGLAFMGERLISIWLSSELECTCIQKNISYKDGRPYITFYDEYIENTEQNKYLIKSIIKEIKSNDDTYIINIYKDNSEENSILVKRYITVCELFERIGIKKDRFKIKLSKKNNNSFTNNKIMTINKK